MSGVYWIGKCQLCDYTIDFSMCPLFWECGLHKKFDIRHSKPMPLPMFLIDECKGPYKKTNKVDVNKLRMD